MSDSEKNSINEDFGSSDLLSDALLFGGNCAIPNDVATCPECPGNLYAHCVEWDSETGRPTTTGVQVDCCNEDEPTCPHKFWQSNWQPVIDAVNEWAKAVD